MTTTTIDPPHRSGPSRGRSGHRHQRLLAAAIVGQPALLTVNTMFHPEVDMTGESLLEGALQGPTTWYVVHVVAAVGAVLGVPAAYAIRTLVPGRGRQLATTGLALTAVGAVLLAFTFAIEASLVHLAATDLPTDIALVVVDAYDGRPEFYAIGLGAAAATLGALLMGAALVRARAVPSWVYPVYFAGAVATMAGTPGTVVAPLGFAGLTVASAGIAVELSRRADRSPTRPGLGG